MSTLNPWADAHANWYNSIPAERRQRYEQMCADVRRRFASCKNIHDNTYIDLNRKADQEYACLCSDFPGDKK
jgi:hypothetical protein